MGTGGVDARAGAEKPRLRPMERPPAPDGPGVDPGIPLASPKLAGSTIQYGIEFDPKKTMRFEARQKRVYAYTLERQRKMIRRERAQRER